MIENKTPAVKKAKKTTAPVVEKKATPKFQFSVQLNFELGLKKADELIQNILSVYGPNYLHSKRSPYSKELHNLFEEVTDNYTTIAKQISEISPTLKRDLLGRLLNEICRGQTYTKVDEALSDFSQGFCPNLNKEKAKQFLIELDHILQIAK